MGDMYEKREDGPETIRRPDLTTHGEVTRNTPDTPRVGNGAYPVDGEFVELQGLGTPRPVAVGIGAVLSVVVGIVTGLDAVVADGVWSWREIAMTLLPILTGTAVHPNVTPVAKRDRGFRRKKLPPIG
jgi:hypothetical protein